MMANKGLVSLKSLVNGGKRKTWAIEEGELDEHDSGEDAGRIVGVIAERFEADDVFLELAGFSKDLVLYWSDMMTPYALNARKRGQMPSFAIS